MDVEVKAGRPGEAGFSLIEALIAAGILLIIAMGLIPLFSQSILNNAAGSDHTQASTFAKDELEDLEGLAFATPRLVVPGTAVENLSTDFWTAGTTDLGDEGWVSVAPSNPRWSRTTRVTQFSVGAFDDGMLTDPERQPGNTQPIQVHFKVIEVQLDSGKKATSGLPPGPRLVYRIIKPF